MNKRVKRLLFVVVYGAMMLLFVELGLQAFYFVTAKQTLFSRVGLPIYVPDDHVVFRLKPNLERKHNTTEFQSTIYTNSEGIRVSGEHEEYELDPGDSVYRILLLGPSFAFGWGVDFEDSFGALLEEYLEAEGFADGKDVEIINAGIPSSPPQFQLEGYKHYWNKYDPDLVISFIYGSMSLSEEHPEKYAVNEQGYLIRNMSAARRLQLALKKSAIVFYSWVIYTRLRPPDADDGTVIGAGRELSLQAAFDPANAEAMASLRHYEALRNAVDEGRSDLLILYLPLSYCVHRGDVARWRHLGVRDVDSQIEFDGAFCDYLGQQGFDCLNITEDLVRQTADTQDRLYYWLDIHWTPYGNRVAARAAARHLLARRASVP